MYDSTINYLVAVELVHARSLAYGVETIAMQVAFLSLMW